MNIEEISPRLNGSVLIDRNRHHNVDVFDRKIQWLDRDFLIKFSANVDGRLSTAENPINKRKIPIESISLLECIRDRMELNMFFFLLLGFERITSLE